MNIAVFHNLWAGGAKRALWEMTRALVARGHSLDVFTLDTADETFLPLRPLVRRYHVEPVAWRTPLATRALPLVLQYVNLSRRLGQLHALAEAQARVAPLIDQGGYDLAFVHHDFLSKAPYLLRQLATPTAYYCQEPLRRYYECPSDGPKATGPRGLRDRVRSAWYAPITPWFERRHKADDFANARAADLILANSDFSREAIIRAYGRTPVLAPLGVDPALFRPLAPPDAVPAIVSVGRFEPNKGQALVIEAVGLLPVGERPEVVLIGESTGDLAYKGHLVALAAARGVNLTLLEDASDADLVAAYNRCLFAVYAPVMEPFGFVPLEAAACGRPTVGVREGGLRETIRDGETGLLVEREAAALARAIARLLADRECCRRLGEQALADVLAHWSWSRSAEILEGRFEALLAAKRPEGAHR